MAEVSGRFPGDALHAAIFTRLDTDLTTPVYDAIPRNLEDSEEFPRVMLSEGDVEFEYIKGQSAGEYQPIFHWFMDIDIYSTYDGWKECFDIAAALKVSMDGTFFDLSANNFTITDQESNFNYDRLWDSDNGREIRHGQFVYEFRIADDL
jgi:hypothetical protein